MRKIGVEERNKSGHLGAEKEESFKSKLYLLLSELRGMHIVFRKLLLRKAQRRGEISKLP